MNKRSISFIILFVLILSMSLIAATEDLDPRLDKKTLSNSRSSNNEAFSIKRIYEGPIYKKSGRQAEVLFVEDPGQSGFGPAIKPDPQWVHYLDMTVGAGNYDWWGPVVDSSDGPPVATMALYDLVIWNCYDWWWTPCFAPTTGAVANMSTYMDGGGKVWFIGQDANFSYGASFLTTFLMPYFEVQSVIDDVIWAIPTIACQGENVLAGFVYGDSADFAANPFFPDEVIPTANGQQIIWDGQYHFNVITNDFISSFWTVDGRICTPDSVFVAVVDSMLTLFGIGAAAPFTWDFEDGDQGWTNTNGNPFPGGWGVIDSGYTVGSYTVGPPMAGDSCMCIDIDAVGSGIGADTAKSPVFDEFADTYLHWAMNYENYANYDTIVVIVRAHDGSSWGGWQFLAGYGSDMHAFWDSADVSGITGDSLQVAWVWEDFFASLSWFCAFDNVGPVILFPSTGHDVACTGVTSPPGGWIVQGDYDVIGRIRNYGGFSETFDVTANVYDTLDSWNVIFTNTVTLTGFPVGGDSFVNLGLATLVEDKIYYTEIYTLLADDDPSNDTSAVYSNTFPFDMVWDFETGWQGWTHTNGLPFPEGWDVLKSGYISSWTPPYAGDSCMWIDSDAAGSGVVVEDTTLSPIVIPSTDMMWLKYGLGYNNLSATSDSLSVGIITFSGGVWNPPVELKQYNADFGPDWDSIDVSAYSTDDSIRIYFFYSGEYDWYAAFDNVMINAVYPGVAEEPGMKTPLVFRLFQNAPNPATNGNTAISYTTTKKGPVALKIFDSAGRLVRTLVDRNEDAGQKTIYWDGRANNHQSVAAGVYFYRLTAKNKSATKKMVVIK